MVEIKICGVKDEHTVEVARNNGATFVGIVTGAPDSPRHVTYEKAGDIIRFARGKIKTVLVTRELTAEFIDRAPLVGSDMVQFHKAKQLRLVERLQDEFTGGVIFAISAEMDDDGLAKRNDIILLDKSQGKGIGIDDTTLANECQRIEKNFRRKLGDIFVAGGFNPSNVMSFLQKHQPRGIDASSGLELTPGVKDQARIKQFCEMIKNSLKNQDGLP